MDPNPILTFDEFPEFLQSRRSIRRYDSTAERKPQHPWWSLDKESIDVLLKNFVQLVLDLLKGAPDTDKELQHLYRTATELSHVSKSPAIKVALLGAQGAGKSLAINALFDCDGLSLTGAEGAACTSSITRYVYYPKSTSGEDKFFAEIQFFTREKRETLLQEHARSFYFYHHQDDDSDDEYGPRVKTLGQDEMDRSLKDTAQDIFTTLFGSLDTFFENWSVASYKSGEFIRLCQLKCDEALQEQQVDSQGIATKMADDQQSLLNQLRPFLTSVSGQICLWPLVDNISIRFFNNLLQGGVELIDLPGWGDINLSRVRHAEEVKDAVDVEIILADTIRIASDDKVINSTRAAIAHHGASNVKVVATKIDSLSKNQLAQCTGEEYDRINQLLQDIEEQEARLDDDDNEDDDANSKQRRTIEQYRCYLERSRKQRKIAQRASHITAELTSKLQGRSANDMPEVFHASASSYMEWIKKPKISFANQPALSPEMTGIPAIRKFLFSLPAQQNLKDYERHINVLIPAFIEKIKRTVIDTDRDGGFRTIADDFDRLRGGFMARLLSQAKSSFQDSSNISIARINNDIPTFKEQVEEKLTEQWFSHKAAAFTRILKCRGVVPKNASKAKGLEDGCHWNRELADLLAPGFNKWSNAHTGRMRTMASALRKGLDQLHRKTITMMNDSSANLVTVEKAKRKWKPLRDQLQAKLMVMMDEVNKLEKVMHECATMEYNQERNLIAYITDDLYTEVFESVPEEKPPVPGKKNKGKRYVTPKIKYQKKKMEELFLSPDNHFVDRTFKKFQTEFDDAVHRLLDRHFEGIGRLLEDFGSTIRAEAPIDYRITPEGESIRAELSEQIPKIQEIAAELRGKIPQPMKQENEMALVPFDYSGAVDDDEEDENLAVIFDKMAKKKRADGPTVTKQNKAKRIKSELI